MRRFKAIMLLTTAGLMMGAGIPNFFSGLIGKNVQSFCEKPVEEQQELIASVNLYTGSHEVVVVCGKTVASADTTDSSASNSARIRRK